MSLSSPFPSPTQSLSITLHICPALTIDVCVILWPAVRSSVDCETDTLYTFPCIACLIPIANSVIFGTKVSPIGAAQKGEPTLLLPSIACVKEFSPIHSPIVSYPLLHIEPHLSISALSLPHPMPPLLPVSSSSHLHHLSPTKPSSIVFVSRKPTKSPTISCIPLTILASIRLCLRLVTAIKSRAASLRSIQRT